MTIALAVLAVITAILVKGPLRIIAIVALAMTSTIEWIGVPTSASGTYHSIALFQVLILSLLLAISFIDEMHGTSIARNSRGEEVDVKSLVHCIVLQIQHEDPSQCDNARQLLARLNAETQSTICSMRAEREEPEPTSDRLSYIPVDRRLGPIDELPDGVVGDPRFIGMCLLGLGERGSQTMRDSEGAELKPSGLVSNHQLLIGLRGFMPQLVRQLWITILMVYLVVHSVSVLLNWE